LIERLQAYRAYLVKAGRMVEARAVARCIEIARTDFLTSHRKGNTMTVRAKFKVEEVTHSTNGHAVKLSPVSSGSTENEQFFKWTPWGEIKIGTINADAAAEFTPGKQFYVDFTPAA
jgi:hypothetical protein